MSRDEYSNKNLKLPSEEEESGSSGQSGAIEFRDFLTTASQTRDDLLSADEKKRLLSQHKDIHELRVKKQKEIRDNRQLLKNGQAEVRKANRQARLAAISPYKPNPILANKAQFSGIDRQVNALPTENVAETNAEMRDELEYQYRLRYAPNNAPQFHPKPIR